MIERVGLSFIALLSTVDCTELPSFPADPTGSIWLVRDLRGLCQWHLAVPIYSTLPFTVHPGVWGYLRLPSWVCPAVSAMVGSCKCMQGRET